MDDAGAVGGVGVGGGVGGVELVEEELEVFVRVLLLVTG